MKLKVGDFVVKNPRTWIKTDFDKWGRGEGIGQVVEPPFELEEDEYDIRWPKGRCFENAKELLQYKKQ